MLRRGTALEAIAPGRPAAVRACEALARRLLPAELGHARQVARLSRLLFDGLGGVLRLPAEARALLLCAAWLHDLGWVEGAAGHHKASQRLILADRGLPLGPEQRRLVACVARYHRKALPSPRHALYAELGREERRWVRLLGGLLRLADGLDRGHRGAVRELDVRLGPGRVLVRCRLAGRGAAERGAAEEKAGLLRRALGREIELAFVSGGTEEER
jgi:exopolyphosphatase/guanosine-5'-triphosphate,3'-diphosphate pyrophosphatase